MGHLAVHQHQVDAAFGHPGQRLVAVFGQPAAQAQLLQHAGADQRIDRVVLGHQHARMAGQAHRARRLGGGQAGFGGRGFSGRRGRNGLADFFATQLKVKTGTLPRRTAATQVAAHGARQVAGNGQAQAGAAAALSARGIALNKGLEDAVDLRRAHTRPGVHHAVAQALPLAAHLDAHAAGRGEFQGIAGQVQQHLPHPRRVHPHPGRHARGHRRLQQQAFVMGHRAQQGHHVARELRRVGRLGLQGQPAVFDAGDVEQVADQRQQVPRRLVHHLQAPGLPRRGRVLLQQLGHAQDAVERRAQFVADGGQETRLGGIGLFGLLHGHRTLFGNGRVFVAEPQQFQQPLLVAAAFLEQHHEVDAQATGNHKVHRATQPQVLQGGGQQGQQHEAQSIAEAAGEGEHTHRSHPHQAGQQHAVQRGITGVGKQGAQQAPTQAVEPGADRMAAVPAAGVPVGRGVLAVGSPVEPTPADGDQLHAQPGQRPAGRRMA